MHLGSQGGLLLSKRSLYGDNLENQQCWALPTVVPGRGPKGRQVYPRGTTGQSPEGPTHGCVSSGNTQEAALYLFCMSPLAMLCPQVSEG